MVPTIQWINKNFIFFNKKYFNNSIPLPKFVLGCPKNMFGCYNADALYSRNKITQINSSGTLCLTNLYSREEKDIQNTLLHEMIHMYIYLVLKIMPSNIHGKEFQKIASTINADGWEISEKNELKPTDITNNTNNNTSQNQPLSIICLVQFNDNQQSGFLAMKVFKTDIKKAKIIKNSIKGAININFFYTQSYGFSQEKSNLSTLYGFVAPNINELASNMSAYYNENINNFDFSKLKLATKQLKEHTDMKKMIITEEQEKKLIKILKESEIQKAQMPVDKKMNKPYCIDPEKVLIVKKHLDNNFRKFNYTTLKGGKKNTIQIVGMMDGENILKYMYKDDLKDYLIDTFQKMFFDKIERELFLSKVIDAWFNNKIGVHGTLDSNFLIQN